jgi:hypothetical protein
MMIQHVRAAIELDRIYFLEGPLLAESSHWHPQIFRVASVRYTPIPATQMLELLNN